MFNLKELTFNFNSNNFQDTFVGIKKKESGKFEFQLPKGFANFPSNNYSHVKNLFFKTYKTYRKFFEEKKKLFEEKHLDGFNESEKGYSIKSKDGQIVFYSKLNMLDSILDAYNELLILTVKNKLSKTNDIDYSKIHRYLHKAIFIDEETVLVDEMEFPKKIIDTDSPTLIEMFCFIYVEIKQALEEKVDSLRAKSLSNQFREKYLSHESSIFEEETFEETIATLKDLLDEIDRTTPYKDSDYWHFYEAVYKFLYGENDNPDDEEGNIWGISNFAIIWEELCFADAKKRLIEDQILFADRIGIIETNKSFQSPFFIQINNHKETRRLLRPDLVYVNYNEDIGINQLRRIYKVIGIKIQNHINIKLIKKFDNHDFDTIYNIYWKYVKKNPKHIEFPNEEKFINVTSNHRNNFLNEIYDYLRSLSLSELMLKKPCILNFTVVDYKYITEETCKADNLSDERKLDIKKQLVYEFALQLNYFGCWTYSEFWIPYFFEDNDKDFEVVTDTNRLFSDNKIIVYKRNFLKLQELYIQENA